MPDLIHQLISHSARITPHATALLFKDQSFSYRALQAEVDTAANAMLALGINPGDRIAIYLPKQPETVFCLFGTAAAGACLVPINPLLKPPQLAHILPHCQARVLITSAARLESLREVLADCPHLQTIVLVDERIPEATRATGQNLVNYAELCRCAPQAKPPPRVASDMTAILYTSGSTGQPRGVMLSHNNMVAGARSAAHYLGNSADDRLLAILPLSFDAGLSQLSTAFSVGASVVLMDHLLPRDVLRAITRYRVTGLAGVPSLWHQLTELDWPAAAVQSLRYITSTGGTMPVSTTLALQQALPNTLIFLMYGLTEAFRSSYLPPDQLSTRPQSIGKAIPDVELLVINEDGQECAPNEPGELVHRGPLVSLGYWDDPEQTARKFRPCTAHPGGRFIPTVWSGDQVRRDEEGFLYFIGRQDNMIKTSGYRVSPTEVEDIAYASGLVAEAAAIGIPHHALGQAILLVVSPAAGALGGTDLEQALRVHCRTGLPSFMQPATIGIQDSLPHNENGKIDRRRLAEEVRFN